MTLEIKNISKIFDKIVIINDLSFNLPRGKITGLIGPNGSGKTTLLNIISGVTAPTKGVITTNGNGREAPSPFTHNIKISRTFQETRIFEQMTILDNVRLAFTPRPILAALFNQKNISYDKKIKKILLQFNLWNKRNSFATELSYGQRKLLEIARVVAMDTEIILLDEPFAGLSQKISFNLERILKKWRKQGKTVLLVEHDINKIRRLCDDIKVLVLGDLLAEGAPEIILKDNKVIDAYLGNIT